MAADAGSGLIKCFLRPALLLRQANSACGALYLWVCKLWDSTADALAVTCTVPLLAPPAGAELSSVLC